MLDLSEPYLLRALLAGLAFALVAGPLGAFVLWQRMAFFGATVSHAALLGVALALWLGVDPYLGVFVMAAVTGIGLSVLERQTPVHADALLGLLAHTTLAMGLIAMAFQEDVRRDLLGYLFGDVLAVGWGDLAVVAGVGAVVLAGLWAIWRPLLAATVHEDLAAVEGVRVGRVRFTFTLLMAAVIAVGMQIVGVLLVVSLLIIPAAAARGLARSPEAMALLGALAGVLAVFLGLSLSVAFDTPSGPSIVVAAAALFLVGLLPLFRRG